MDWPPFDFVIGNQPAGYTVDLMRLIAQKTGMNIEFINGYTWAELWQMFEDGSIDIVHPVAHTDYRKQFGIYSTRVFAGSYVFVTRTSAPRIESIQQIKDKIIATPKSFAQTKFLQKHYPEIELLLTQSQDEARDAVAQNRAYAAIGNDAVMSYQLRMQMDRSLKINGLFHEYNDGVNNDLYFLIQKDQPILHSIFEKGLKAISVGEIEELQKKWFGDRVLEPKSSLDLTQQELEFIYANPVIRISNEHDYMPFDFSIDSQPKGYSIDLAKVVAQKLGIELEFVSGYEWVNLLGMFKDRKIDILHTTVKTPQRQRYAIFSQEYFSNSSHFVTKKGVQNITHASQLHGRVAAVANAYATQEFLSLNYPAIDLLIVANVEQALEAVAKDRADVAVLDYAVAKYYIDTKGYDLVVADKFSEYNDSVDTGYRFMFHQDMPELQSMFNKALDSIGEQKLEKLYAKWFENGGISFIKSLNLTQKQKEYLEQKDVLKYCSFDGWLPFTKMGNSDMPIGIGADLMEELGAILDVSIEFHAVKSCEAIIQAKKSTDCDIFPVALPTSKKAPYYDFTQPYITESLNLATKHSEIFTASPMELKGKKIGVSQGFGYKKLLHQKYGEQFEIVRKKSVKKGLEALQKGELYGFVDVAPVLGYTIRQYKFNDLKVAGDLGIKVDIAIATNSAQPHLAPIMQKALAMIDDETRSNIINRWYYVSFESVTDYSLVWKIVTGATVLFLFIVFWNRKLNSAKNKTLEALAKLNDAQKELQRLAVTDRLTNLYNRYKIDEVIESQKNRADRYGEEFCLIIIDADHFKRVNDDFGHQIGDEVLVAIGEILQKEVRSTDILARWGGEEFMVICPHTQLSGAKQLALKLKDKVAKHQFAHGLQQTISLGVTQYQKQESIKDLVARSDRALFKAKEDGRDRVVAW